MTMTTGERIRRLREERGLTQDRLAGKLGVSFQAVSSWERDEYLPSLENLIQLAEILDVSTSAILEERTYSFETKQAIYDWTHMKTFVKTTSKVLGLTDTSRALAFALKAHEDQKRKKSDIPYICHPLTVACHALALGVRKDEVVAACLLHDVIEDCGITAEELPVSDRTKEIVLLLTHEKEDGENRDRLMKEYYGKLARDPDAALVECLDRCNNLTTMAWGLSRERICRMIRETEEYFPALMKTVKNTPEYNDAAWLIQYHMDSMLDIFKRLL